MPKKRVKGNKMLKRPSYELEAIVGGNSEANVAHAWQWHTRIDH